MIHVDNRSGFPAELLSIADVDGQEAQVLVVSARWTQQSGAETLTPVPDQPPLPLADEYWGDPVSSSVRCEAQCATEKPRVDVLVNGTAYVPGGRPAREVIVELEAGGIRKRVRVIGDRVRTMIGASAPQPFVSMPLVYERAFGGTDARRNVVWRPNPVGLGFRGSRSASPDIATEYPNLEPVGASLEAGPAGFGIISRGWSPRLELAGTFDQRWLDTQWPLMPRDFDVRHYQAAPSDQQTDELRTGDPVRLVNFTPDGEWRFAMPEMALSVWLMFDGGKRKAHPRADTVLIEPDCRCVTLTFRLKLSLARGRDRLREIVVGPVTPGMLRAKERRKPYIHPRDLGTRVGTESGAA